MGTKKSARGRIVSTAVIAAVSCLVLATAGKVLADEPIVVRFSHVVSESTPKGIGAELFKKRVEERLAGKVRVEVYPNSQRFTDEQVLLGLLFGDVQLAAPSLAKFRSFSPRLQVFDLPYLFDDMGAVKRFQASPVGLDLLSAMSARGIKGLAYWNNGMRVMSADKPLRAPTDAAGLVFRIEPSRVMEAQYEALGALALELPFHRVYDALASGLVDGQENAWSNIHSRAFHQLQKDFTETRHSVLAYMVVTSTRFWDSLPADIRTELEVILSEVTLEVNRIAEEKAQSARQAVLDEGGRALELTAEERQAWKDALKPVWQRFQGEIGQDVIDAAMASNSEQ